MSDDDIEVPDGKVAMVVTYLEMSERPTDPGPPVPALNSPLTKSALDTSGLV